MNPQLKQNIEDAKTILFKKTKNGRVLLSKLVTWNFLTITFSAILVMGIVLLIGNKIDVNYRILLITSFLIILNFYFPLKIIFLKKIILYKDINNYKFLKFLVPYFYVSFQYSYIKEIRKSILESKIDKSTEPKILHIAKYFDYYNILDYKLTLLHFEKNNIPINKYTVLTYLIKQYKLDKNFEALNVFLSINKLKKSQLTSILKDNKLSTFSITETKMEYIFSMMKVCSEMKEKSKKNAKFGVIVSNVFSIISQPLYYMITVIYIFLFMIRSSSQFARLDGTEYGPTYIIYQYAIFKLIWLSLIIISAVAFFIVLKHWQMDKKTKTIYMSTFITLLLFNLVITTLFWVTYNLDLSSNVEALLTFLSLFWILIMSVPFAFYLNALIRINVDWYQNYYNIESKK
ncbi:hypothetical protein OF363_01605 [Mycoplasma enhydrae]|uniref:hypothetical protein n=1 Tax=Mycoplasma enhydrae TaxID=2499220 RepID=UPI0021E7EB5D|nr:hypothetical protein [Mycoplasma enhydrae]MCV3733728.1 hypothetical protein [Mycoplasma enhydrae]